MTVLLSIVAQLLHMAAVLAGAPVLTGIVGMIGNRLTGQSMPPVLRPLQEVVRLFRKQTIRAEGTSIVSRLAPLVAVVLAVLTAFLIPSFCLGMVSSPLADLLTIAALFVFGRTVLVLAAMDTGTGAGAVAATDIAGLAMVAEPALLLVVFALALPASAGNLDTILTVRIEGLVPATPAIALAVAALGLLGWSDRQRPATDSTFSGGDLALLRIAEQVRLLAWCDLIGALALPFGLAPANDGFLSWGIGFLAWIGRSLLAAAILAVARAMGASYRVRTVLALALALCGIAAVLAFTGGDPT